MNKNLPIFKKNIFLYEHTPSNLDLLSVQFPDALSVCPSFYLKSKAIITPNFWAFIQKIFYLLSYSLFHMQT